MKTGILGGYDVGRSTMLTDNRIVNLYMEAAESEASEIGALYPCPGKSLFNAYGSGPIRGLIEALGNLYVVSGNLVYVTTTKGFTTQLGPIQSVSGPVSMIANPTQVAFFDGTNGYLIEAGVLSMISLPFSLPTIASYQDGFGLVAQGDSNVFWQSDLNDLSTWNALNFSSADGTPDNIVAIHEMHREQWIFKEKHIEVWDDAGLTGFAFARNQGVFTEDGCAAAFSVCSAGENLIWLANSSRGTGMVRLSRGYEPVPVSTHSIDRIIQGIATTSTIADAVAYTYQEDGHTFYVITFPSGNLTLGYDISESIKTRQHLWHQRAAFLNGNLNQDRAPYHVFFNGQHLVGDSSNGNVYVQALGIRKDNGAPIKLLRTWRALPERVLQPVSFKTLQIVMQTGIGVPES